MPFVLWYEQARDKPGVWVSNYNMAGNCYAYIDHVMYDAVTDITHEAHVGYARERDITMGASSTTRRGKIYNWRFTPWRPIYSGRYAYNAQNERLIDFETVWMMGWNDRRRIFNGLIPTIPRAAALMSWRRMWKTEVKEGVTAAAWHPLRMRQWVLDGEELKDWPAENE